ncbi:hypothetical protein BUALT_BualtMtG0002200 (mitochondrion) [Buddleja alternifolia]|uniref:Ribosomal protein S12 n=1 Tax=Buddleja alternifolia TaxID=168488 RepID=A0AAV6W7W8_9LAMI|nr:hypothetical protein BUALT_BualtMtG0002200 [Buddleja alternifolia]
MPTLNQLIRHGREEKRRTDRTRALDQCPQKEGVCPRVSTRTPKKPNSALRKIAKVQLSNKHDIFAHIPGEGHNSQEHSKVPVIVIRLLEPRGLSVETSTNNRRFLMVFPLLTAALSTPPDIWCQIVARFLISLIIELAIFVASIVQVREEGWTSGMRESGSIDKKEE